MKTKMENRNEFATLLKEMGLTGVAAEVGVAEGYFSFYLLDRWPGICYQIDPWAVLNEPGYSLHGEVDQEARYQRIMAKAARYGGRAIPKRATSLSAVYDFTDGFFDFVYIDANHTLLSARDDIRAWYSKVKVGGVLAGHDYLDGIYNGDEYGVKTAVTELSQRTGLQVNTTLETDWPSWWVVKK